MKQTVKPGGLENFRTRALPEDAREGFDMLQIDRADGRMPLWPVSV